jgi:hypothetical protein
MEIAVLIAVVVIGGLVTLCCGALLEVFRQLAEVRTVLSLDDQPKPLNLQGLDASLEELGMPSTIGKKPEEIVVFLSGTCATCLAIAEAFRGGSPDSVWFVVAARETHKVVAPLRSSGERLVVDQEGAIAARLGLEIVPTVLTLTYGGIGRAYAVGTPRQVMGLIPATPAAGVLSEGPIVGEAANGARRAYAEP